MKLILLLFLIYSSLMINIINAQSKPSVLTIQGTLFDHNPLYNHNFETTIGSSVITAGMVQAKLNSTNRIPVLVSNDASYSQNKLGSITHPLSFPFHFVSNNNAPLTDGSNANIPMKYEILLNYDEKAGTYIYDNQYFYPIDNQGYDVNPSFRIYKQNGVYHNFHFCLRINSRFTYNGGEVFNFIGDDDVWVFIDDKLAVDIGGVHPPQKGNVKLDSLGLTKNKVYNFDFFYCERHTDGSTIHIETSIEAYCPWYDYCLVCTGDGRTCCNPLTTCNDNNPCTIDECPLPSLQIPADQISANCVHTPVSCPVIDKCTINSCSIKDGGKCVSTKLECPIRESECLVLDRCDPNQGCIYTPKCNTPCSTGKCLAGGICEAKTTATCSSELDNDPCKIYSCDPIRGCVSELKCKQDPTKPCDQAICVNGNCEVKKLNATECDCKCDLSSGCVKNNCVNNKCVPLPLDSLDDGNACTIDECKNGVVTHTFNTTQCTGCSKCNPQNGKCDLIDSVCQDGNECTVNVCAKVSDSEGQCSNSTTPCDFGDRCKVYSCDTTSGCVEEDLVCPDDGNCRVGYCDKDRGCQLKPRECPSPAFCIVSECDEAVGCISYDKRCASENPKCKAGVCKNATETEEGRCDSVDYDPKPFICQTAAVVSTAVIAGVTVAGAVALAAFIFGGKKGYDYWKESRSITMSGSNSNPLYEQSQNAGENPLYVRDSDL